MMLMISMDGNVINMYVFDLALHILRSFLIFISISGVDLSFEPLNSFLSGSKSFHF